MLAITAISRMLTIAAVVADAIDFFTQSAERFGLIPSKFDTSNVNRNTRCNGIVEADFGWNDRAVKAASPLPVMPKMTNGAPIKDVPMRRMGFIAQQALPEKTSKTTHADPCSLPALLLHAVASESVCQLRLLTETD